MPALRDIHPRSLCLLPPRRFSVSFQQGDIGRFVNPTALLNDECLNGGGLLLQTQLARLAEDNSHGFDARTVAILSTHDLVRVRYGASDDQLWRNVKHTEYWDKLIWVLPIHRRDAHHWVACVIYPELKKLHLFDSFADRRGWHVDVQVCAIVLFEFKYLLIYYLGYHASYCPSINACTEEWFSGRAE